MILPASILHALRLLLSVAILAGTAIAAAPAYRTDRSEGDALPWFQLVHGEFPPPDSAHHIMGELISFDHVDRTFVIRADRTDKQNRSHWDLPLSASMLPYGSIFYHGSWAAIEDIPVGTHLHGQFYLKAPSDKSKPIAAYAGRVTPEADFNRCFLLEDDFSYHKRLGQSWKIESVDLESKKLSATLLEHGQPSGPSKQFDLLDHTRVWAGKGFDSPAALRAGQNVRFNLTWATLYGPGRLLDVWVDEKAQNEAASHQLKKHHQHVRERGLPAIITAVDNPNRLLTLTFFSNVDPSLFEALQITEEVGEEKERNNISVAVALESLAAFDPVNDRQGGPLRSKSTVPKAPGCSGLQIQFRPNFLLEGFRPQKIVRVYAHGWPVIDMPKELRWEGREHDAAPFGK